MSIQNLYCSPSIWPGTHGAPVVPVGGIPVPVVAGVVIGTGLPVPVVPVAGVVAGPVVPVAGVPVPVGVTGVVTGPVVPVGGVPVGAVVAGVVPGEPVPVAPDVGTGGVVGGPAVVPVGAGFSQHNPVWPAGHTEANISESTVKKRGNSISKIEIKHQKDRNVPFKK